MNCTVFYLISAYIVYACQICRISNITYLHAKYRYIFIEVKEKIDAYVAITLSNKASAFFYYFRSVLINQSLGVTVFLHYVLCLIAQYVVKGIWSLELKHNILYKILLKYYRNVKYGNMTCV